MSKPSRAVTVGAFLASATCILILNRYTILWMASTDRGRIERRAILDAAQEGYCWEHIYPQQSNCAGNHAYPESQIVINLIDETHASAMLQKTGETLYLKRWNDGTWHAGVVGTNLPLN